MDCLAPLLTTTSSVLYESPFSSCSLRTMAARSGAVPVFGVYRVIPSLRPSYWRLGMQLLPR